MTSVTRYYLIIVVSVVLIASIFGYLWLSPQSNFKEFGLNGFTETLGIGITVFLIDFLQKKREEARMLPQRIAAHEDVRVVIERILGFWYTAYLLSVPDEAPQCIDDLVSATTINKIYSHLDMDSFANVTPRQNWWSFLPENLRDFQKRAEVILERHNSTLDPPAYGWVHVLAHEPMEPNYCNVLRKSDSEYGYPRPRNLGGYCFFTEEYFPTVLALADWCNDEADTIGKVSGKSLLRITKQLPTQQRSEISSCMINPQDFASQLVALEQYRVRTEATNSSGGGVPLGSIVQPLSS